MEYAERLASNSQSKGYVLDILFSCLAGAARSDRSQKHIASNLLTDQFIKVRDSLIISNMYNVQ